MLVGAVLRSWSQGECEVVEIPAVKGVGDGGAEIVVRSRRALSLVNGGVEPLVLVSALAA
jgi:hypothetical protein